MPNPMHWLDACNHARRLWETWIGHVPSDRNWHTASDFERVRQSALAELRYARTKPGRRGVVREIRADLILLGKVKKALEVKDNV